MLLLGRKCYRVDPMAMVRIFQQNEYCRIEKRPSRGERRRRTRTATSIWNFSSFFFTYLTLGVAHCCIDKFANVSNNYCRLTFEALTSRKRKMTMKKIRKEGKRDAVYRRWLIHSTESTNNSTLFKMSSPTIDLYGYIYIVHVHTGIQLQWLHLMV